ncbi:MAG: amidoligase family protein [Lachnospiraceae bacterium]|nr:amidoligase family protein [Ruminococcus sp.]MCM1276662.1 amidoligase family protein [Lachnospiraceae bacterium]
MANNFDGIKLQKFGVEIECTGLTRAMAARAVAKVLHSRHSHDGGFYDKYTVKDFENRRWSVVYDSSIKKFDRNGCPTDSDKYAVELVTPVLEYKDIELLQEIVRAVRKAGGITGAQFNCGIHIHIDGAPYDARSVRNLVNLFASKENFLFDVLQVAHERESYCQKVDRNFLEKINAKKNITMDDIQNYWYNGNLNEVRHHYSRTRYRTLNLHSLFADGHWEMRACNSSLHAGVIRSYIVLALAISNAALTRKFCSPKISESDNLRYSCRVWLINLGLNGEEFKNCRKHLISHLDGCISWRKQDVCAVAPKGGKDAANRGQHAAYLRMLSLNGNG